MHKRYTFILLIIGTLQVMAQQEIKTSIQIAASPETVWKVLTDFSAYPHWNPFLLSAEGILEEGEKLKINAGGMKFTPKILVVKENQQLTWKGKFLFKRLFDGLHSFEIRDNGDGNVTFVQQEKFTGILVGLFKKKIQGETKSGFEAMNAVLKQRAESYTEH